MQYSYLPSQVSGMFFSGLLLCYPLLLERVGMEKPSLPDKHLNTPNAVACGKYWTLIPLVVENSRRNRYIFFVCLLLEKNSIFFLTMANENYFNLCNVQ